MRRASPNVKRVSSFEGGEAEPLVFVNAINIELTEADKALIKRLALRMARFDPKLLGCHVTVRGEVSKRKEKCNSAVVEFRVASQAPVVARSSDSKHVVAIRKAFDAGRRRLQDKVRIRRGQVKNHGHEVQFSAVAAVESDPSNNQRRTD